MRNELYNIDIPDPMLVGKKPTNYQEKLKSNNWLGSKKIDGYFEFLCRGENGEPYMFSRTKSRKTGFFTEKIDHVPHLKEWIEENLPNDSIVCAEVYVPGGTSKDITKILGCLPEKAIKRQKEQGNLCFWLHDMIRYGGKDYVVDELDYSRRFSSLCEHLDIGAKYYDGIDVAPVYDSVYINLEDKVEELLSQGEEGMVLRTKDGLYLPGKRRPEIMFKIKQDIEDLDFVIMDVLDPEKDYNGKCLETWEYWEGDTPVTKAYYMGWKNAFKLGLYDESGNLQEVGRVASGFTDELREDCGQKPEEYIGKVAKISCMSVDKKEHTFRHPVLLEVREDKNAKECLMKDVF